jgi:hypothetical protein
VLLRGGPYPGLLENEEQQGRDFSLGRLQERAHDERLGKPSVGRNPQRSVSILLLEECSALLQQDSAAETEL